MAEGYLHTRSDRAADSFPVWQAFDGEIIEFRDGDAPAYNQVIRALPYDLQFVEKVGEGGFPDSSRWGEFANVAFKLTSFVKVGGAESNMHRFASVAFKLI